MASSGAIRAPDSTARRARASRSGYALQLREKQKVRRTYGMLERQFQRYFDIAARRPGKTSDNLLQMLEMRLDNVVYRMGFGDSRAQARQLVTHGHFQVNGRKSDIPSMILRPEMEVAVREGSKNSEYFKTRALMLAQKGIPALAASGCQYALGPNSRPADPARAEAALR